MTIETPMTPNINSRKTSTDQKAFDTFSSPLERKKKIAKTKTTIKKAIKKPYANLFDSIIVRTPEVFFGDVSSLRFLSSSSFS